LTSTLTLTLTPTLTLNIDVEFDVHSDIDTGADHDTDMACDADTDIDFGIGSEMDVDSKCMYVMGPCMSKLRCAASRAGLGLSRMSSAKCCKPFWRLAYTARYVEMISGAYGAPKLMMVIICGLYMMTVMTVMIGRLR
jgi:hypothetical protein